jgi:pSer/pThr/pTyr-binding forkhead associated (FHA) protein
MAGNVFIIGREAPADLVIPEPTISYRHAQIEVLGGGHYFLTDLGSTNGTFVNGQRIQSARIQATDYIYFGGFQFDLSRYAPMLEPGRGRAPWNPASGWPAAQPVPHPAPPPHQPTDKIGGTAENKSPIPRPAATPAGAKQQPRPVRPRVAKPGMGTEVAVALAMQKTYGGKAFWVWVLYWFFFIPGAIMNIVYWNEAKRVRQITGTNPSGMGCLTFLLVTHLVIPGILLLLLIMLLIAAPASLSHYLRGSR